MNYVILNGEVVDGTIANVAINNRAFKYGDSLFESIVCCKGEIKFFQYHWERLLKGMQILKLNFSNSVDYEEIRGNIMELINLNKCDQNARIRLQVFRNSGGLYTPIDNTTGYLIEANIFETKYGIEDCKGSKGSVGFCESIMLNFNAISSLKSCNSIPYVVASLEKQQKQMEDLIILDDKNNIAECCASNIFWWDGNKIYTPGLDSGCISGVMRRVLLETFYQNSSPCEEGLFPIAMLKSAKAIFTSNCMGIKWVDTIVDDQKMWHQTNKELFINSPIFASIQSLF